MGSLEASEGLGGEVVVAARLHRDHTLPAAGITFGPRTIGPLALVVAGAAVSATTKVDDGKNATVAATAAYPIATHGTGGNDTPRRPRAPTRSPTAEPGSRQRSAKGPSSPGPFAEVEGSGSGRREDRLRGLGGLRRRGVPHDVEEDQGQVRADGRADDRGDDGEPLGRVEAEPRTDEGGDQRGREARGPRPGRPVAVHQAR